MSWSTEFIETLAATPRRVVLRVSRLETYLEPGSPYSIGSIVGVGSDTELRISENGAQVQGQTLNPRGPWSTTIGAFSVELVGNPYTLMRSIVKGTILQLDASFDGGQLWGTIAVGQYQNLRGTGPIYSLECRDIFGAMKSRMDPTAYSTMSLFWELHSTTLSADSAVADAVYDVVGSAVGWQKENGGYGGMKVTPAGGGDPYYRLWSATTATTVTIQDPGTASVMGTTDVGATNGDVAQEVVYLTGHPFDIVRKVLVSRGSGANGAYDTLPAHCGLGLVDGLLDHAEIDAWKANVVVASSGSYSWELAVDDVVDDAYSWLQSILSPSGLFLAIRQGQIVLRAAQVMGSGIAAYPGTAYLMEDDEIDEILEWELFASDFGTEFAALEVEAAGALGASAFNAPVTLPAEEIAYLDITPMVFSNAAAIRNDVATRCGESATKIPSRVRVRTKHLKAASLCIGDPLRIITSRLPAEVRFNSSGGPLLMVDDVSVDLMGGSVTVGALLYPETEEMYPA